jgi:hypothetical protein
MNHNRKGFFSYIFDPEKEVVEHLIKHIYNRSIADSLIKIMSDNSDVVDSKKDYLLRIIDSISTQEFEGKLNSAMVLTDIMDSKSVSDYYKSREVSEKLFAQIRSDDDLTTRCSLQVLTSLYKKFPFWVPRQADSDKDDFAKMYLPQQDTEDMEIMPHIDEILKENLPFIETILDVVPKGTLEQQYGEIIKPFGATKLQAAKFITNIIAVGNQEYAISLAACLPTLLKFCIEYPWNSMLHNCVESLFFELFKKSSKYNDEIKTAVIAESNLTDFIANCPVDATMRDSGRTIRGGFIATIVNIANMLKDNDSEYVQEELAKSDNWVEFMHSELSISNSRNEMALAGHQSKAGDSDEDSANYETSMDKLFAVFTNLKESHDSSRDESSSDEEEVDTTNILKDVDTSSESSETQPKEETKSHEPEDNGKYGFAQAKKQNDEKLASIAAQKEKSEKEKAEKAASEEDDNTSETNTYYDNSYWSLQPTYSLDALLQDI